ncbi:MAG: STAS domain-containing protein [Chloroflexi bacterium AL-W]|nr:STAS domain-containing protein [Chloroflexi bacterium AL-N1]NOK69552.1 STAS domain-containing protein [Chloroflexi bacterium AL-N10]NOK77517.1 STAS domain-containing protein [Chloroflexi bacterium AL-N5]NOK84368.1 STAS domain-containing protein [Chloroflexi bacterium AL-W]NOK91466.1 STAS domain-containing protein [Chloroflexi bacterium AL-N15]
MNITQRQINLAILGLIAGTSLLGGIFAIIRGNQLSTAIGIVGFFIFAGLYLAYWYGWDMARHVAVTFAVLIVGFGYREPFLTSELTLIFIIPPLLAHVLAGPRWVLGSAFATLAIILVRAGGTGVYTDPTTLLFYSTIVGGMILSRLAHSNAQQLAEANERVTEALANAKQQARANEQQAQALAEQNEAQQRLLELVATLETPTVTMADGVFLPPSWGISIASVPIG